MDDPTLLKIAEKVRPALLSQLNLHRQGTQHKRTPGQVLIRCTLSRLSTHRRLELVFGIGSLQKGFVPLPKSDREERISQSFLFVTSETIA